MRKSIHNNYGIEIDDVDYDILLENIRSLVFVVIGIIVIILNVLVDKYMHSNVLSSFLCVIWWVALWDMIEIQTMDKTENKWKRLNYLQLFDAEITFVFEEDNE